MKLKLGWQKRLLASGFLISSVMFVGACSDPGANSGAEEASSESLSGEVLRVAIGTQDQVINTAVGGATVRELGLLEKHLPTTGKYEGVEYDMQWSSYTSGPPITNKMLADQIDIGLMGDFPAVINLIKFQQEADDADSIYIGTLAYSPNGAGNAVVVPKDSEATSLADLEGGTISVPFGSAAHGMVLKALDDVGINPETDVTLISQAPEVGGSSLRTGQIDAHADFVPFGELFPFRGFAKKIFDGAQTGVPTLHGITVRSDFAEEHPEIVVAYLKAVLEANQIFRESPEEISANIEEWSGIEKEVVYMFLGPSGLQPLDPTIREVHVEALKNSIATLTSLGKIENPVDPAEVTNWIDESYLQQAMEEMDLVYDEVIATAEAYQITGEDALTGEAIEDPKLAAQYWVQGEETVTNFASIGNMLEALAALQAEGKAADVMFVHDRNNGWKLFAENSYYVSNGDEVSAFLLESDAQAYAAETGGQMMAFRGLQDRYAKGRQPTLVGALVGGRR
ncbi:ABC-type nitrate/sulfonate/bicarbonate transport system, periplasmic component tauA and NosL [Halomicronema hongdechloris C2206]|uniref:Putative aliphatic sulfonates-binding protein n=1 Tax=Halomicronema hongdechloris C2206 TaxID=1641165 RepID=A0A1Z3HKD6_9CYAN|nr:ABC-type nitrate/sulfonate/bicarbonate transport system, periplasmic component tauA and NosL [Halomicronema hongdechloris C2206]